MAVETTTRPLGALPGHERLSVLPEPRKVLARWVLPHELQLAGFRAGRPGSSRRLTAARKLQGAAP